MKSDLSFRGTDSSSSLMAGTATARNSALGTYTIDLNSIKFTDACDGTAGGTFTIRGGDGDAVIDYGPSCNRTCVSIKGSAQGCS